MVNIKTLLPELKKLVTELSEDLLARSTASAEIDAGLREAYTQIEKGGRTADAFEVWREDYLDQVAVAWVLGCVFVRFMEDNHLIDECWLAGEGNRRKQAEDSHELYFREHPRESDREYFEHVFHEVGKIPACQDLFAEGKTPLWAVGPSGDAAMKLLAFWREIDTDGGQLKRTFDVEDGDTRFLGDLYQDLSERARKKYALLQTPVFVEEFILDRTLNPAIDEFGLDEVRMIDPTCGSGHFLLGGFTRLFDLWIKREDNDIVAAQKALDGVWGVDVNPFAVAIARFRLIVAALKACNLSRLQRAPGWKVHLATGDSLLFGNRWTTDGGKRAEQQFFATEEGSWAPEIYACEDKDAISEVLGQQYHVVVGNPPYITVKDKGLNQAYRDKYPVTCHRQYSLGAPFAERFFDLAISAENGPAGFVGTITSNSFMKREFGKPLVCKFFPRVDLSCVVDAAGAYVPGHGTPTVLLFGRNRLPTTQTVRAVLGIQGEPSTPDDPADGLVWRSILRNVEQSNGLDEFTSSADVPRKLLNSHPWSLSGGGASELAAQIESKGTSKLGDVINDIGRTTHTGEDDVFYLPPAAAATKGLTGECVPLVVGEGLRDWSLSFETYSIFPYNSDAEPKKPTATPLAQHFWAYRTTLRNRKDFGQTIEERGLQWFEHSMFFPNRFRAPLSIAFPFVASHNHFILDRGSKVFNRSAPTITLLPQFSDDDYFTILGLLNSSAICFWMKAVSHQKQLTGGDGVRVQSRAKVPYEFSATQLKNAPLPQQIREGNLRERLKALAEACVLLSDDEHSPTAGSAIELGLQSGEDIRISFEATQQSRAKARQRLVFLQEEIDFTTYAMFGFVGTDLLLDDWSSLDAPVDAGCRPFELMQKRNLDGFPVPDTLPESWPKPVQEVWRKRMAAIEESKELRLIEDDHYKRRWIGRQGLFNHAARQDELGEACRDWLWNRLESRYFWPEGEPKLQSAASLADKTVGDREFTQVAAVYRNRQDFDMAELVAELVKAESVPFLPKLHYKSSGLRKREVWEKTWELQRKEDAGEDVGDIKVPPKYTSADFQKSDYWRLRGKLDVPKERWISFPHCETEGDPSLVVGWAGWNHLQQGTAIVAYYDARKNEGWSAERLTPLLAALDQLLPWIHQWHPEIDPEYNETAGTSFQTLLESEAQELGLTLEQIRSWTPPAKKNATKKKAATKPRKKAKSAEAMEGE